MKVVFWIAVASGPLALGLWWLAGLVPSLVEAVYSRGLYPLLMGPWSRLTGLVPFPVAPVVVVLLVLIALSLFFVLPPLRVLSLIGACVSVLTAWFVLGWGLNYQRQSWADSHGLRVAGGTVAELESLARTLADAAGPLRQRALSSGPVGWASPELRSAVSRAFERVGESDPLLAGRYADPKAVPFPELMSWLGLAGICIPHTGEPLVNTGPGDWQLPFTSAHEAAHLRGWAREDEANYLAFLVLSDDPAPALAYSAWASALLYVAGALEASGAEGRQAWGGVLERVDPGIRRDWKESFAYWERFRGPVMEASRAVNDLYLKSQGQSDGVRSYGRMVDLLLAWHRSSGGTASSPETPPPAR